MTTVFFAPNESKKKSAKYRIAATVVERILRNSSRAIFSQSHLSDAIDVLLDDLSLVVGVPQKRIFAAVHGFVVVADGTCDDFF